MRRVGGTLLVFVVFITLGAPWLAPNEPDRRFPDLAYAPPTSVHVRSLLHIRRWRVTNRLERRFSTNGEPVVALRWFADGRLVTGNPDAGAPLLLLGADSYGRDMFARLLYGGRVTLALAGLSVIAAIGLGALVGGVAGYVGGWPDRLLSRLSEFVLVLPTIYVALALRSVLPLVLPASYLFAALAVVFALLGWPVVARGVRAIVASERHREYVLAARALGAGPGRILWRHVLPAAAGHMAVQAALLLPAFILAEATLSYVGLGFPDSVPTWGTMLQDAANVTALGRAPWMLAPAAAIAVTVLGLNLIVQGGGRVPIQLKP